MTAEWYDLGQRLHAARAGHVAARLTRSPIPLISNPVAVRARQRAGTVTVTAAVTGSADRAASGTGALGLLHDLGVRITAGAPRTLITDDTVTLPALTALAVAAARDGDQADTAAHIAWWADRIDYPGSTAVVPLIDGCRTRWITGAPPAAETHARTWRAWLNMPDESCAGMLALLAMLNDGQALTLLDRIGRDDEASWKRAQQAHIDGRDWRHPDTVGRAAVGLRSRCDTHDLYDAALLTDPLYRRRAVHTGHVVTGTVTVQPGRYPKLTVTCDRLDARLRAGNAVTGWAGTPEDTGMQTFRGTISNAAVNAGALDLTVSEVGANLPATGDRVTLHPAAPTDFNFTSGRHRLMQLYGSRTSWLTTGRRPTLARRDVPLDVIIAAAEPGEGQ